MSARWSKRPLPEYVAEEKSIVRDVGRSREGGLIVRKMNGERGTGDTLGQTLMDSVPVGNDGNTGSDLGFAATGNSVITHTHVQTYTHKLLPICLLLCLALTQYYQSHHSSCVILLRDTN